MDGWNLTFRKSWVSWSRLDCRFQSLQHSCAHTHAHRCRLGTSLHWDTCGGGGCARITVGSVSHRKSPALLWPRAQLHLPPSASLPAPQRSAGCSHTRPPLALCSCTTSSTGAPGNVSLLSSKFLLLRAQLRLFPFTKHPECPLKVSVRSTPLCLSCRAWGCQTAGLPPGLICPPGLDYELLGTRVCL